MKVLIVGATRETDPCSGLVADAVVERGGQAFYVDAGRFPTDIPLEARTGAGNAARIDHIDANKVTSVWLRNTEPGRDLPGDMRADFRRASKAMSSAALSAWLGCLDGFVVDPPAVFARVPDKLGQTKLAASFGIEVPDTLMTNDPDAVRRFTAQHPAGVVTKMIDSRVLLAGEPVYTRTVDAEDLADLDGLRLCPMLFQERIAKAKELRITIVGTRMFVASVTAGESTAGADDWRKDRALVDSFVPDALPDSIAIKLTRLIDYFGLNYGSIDMIVTPDGRYVFVELNTICYFHFVERATGLPIAGAVADMLLGRHDVRRAR